MRVKLVIYVIGKFFSFTEEDYVCASILSSAVIVTNFLKNEV